MAERRRSKRISAHLKVWCEGEELTLLSATVNMSKHGLFLRASRPFLPGSRLRLTIDELGVEAEVDVRWNRGPRESSQPGIGVEILSFTRGEAAFERYVEQSTSRSGEHRLHVTPTSRSTD